MAPATVKRDPNVGVIMLSMHCDKTFLVRALAACRQPLHNADVAGKTTCVKCKSVLQLLAEGKSNKEAASLLSVSLYTIETHRSRHSTADIVLYAVRKRINR